MEQPKHPETMSQEELNAHLNSLSDGELTMTVATYADRWRRYLAGFPRFQNERDFIRTGRNIRQHYMNRHGLAV